MRVSYFFGLPTHLARSIFCLLRDLFVQRQTLYYFSTVVIALDVHREAELCFKEMHLDALTGFK